jgi:methylthioribose-1-phosphate isomerase
LGIVTKAWELGKLKHVYMDETRPLLQGARLTSWEMKKANIPATLIADNTAAVLMQEKKIDVVIVGADRIAMNGDVANKVGTYNVAVLAHHHGIPFFVAAPITSIDVACETGEAIPIEQRDGKELTHLDGKSVAPDSVGTYSPAFDVTPHELVTAIITDKGILYPPYRVSLASVQPSPKSSG